MRLGIRSKLFLVSLGLITLSVITGDAYLSRSIDALLTERIRDDLSVRLTLIEREATRSPHPLTDVPAWNRLAQELGRLAAGRLTFIRQDGVVIGDSEVGASQLGEIENHLDRTEVREALDRGHGASLRYSRTVKRRMLYVAVPFGHATPGNPTARGVARLSLPLTQVDASIGRLQRLVFFGMALALVLAVIMSSLAAQWMSRIVRKLTETARRMAAGDLAARARVAGEDEVAELGHALDHLAGSLFTTLDALRAERDLLSRILNGMEEGVLVLEQPADPPAGPSEAARDLPLGTSKIALINPALRQMLLVSQDALGRPLQGVIRHAELKQLLERARLSPTGQLGEIELSGLKPRRLLVRAAAFTGEPGGLLAVFVDVTDLRRLESVRRDFVANASHELRTPVAAIKSAAETLQGALKGDPQAAPRFVDIIERNSERLQRLLEDLLDLSKVESREFQPNLEDIAVKPLIDQIVALHRDRAEKKRVLLSTQVGANMPAAKVDRRALEQVVGNLVDNAVKYTTERSQVTVRADADADEQYVRLTVEDTGPGIEAKHLPRLFERFYRVDAGRSRELGGTGLGLSIVKHLVEAMNGDIEVASVLGKGTKFTVRLPRA